MKSTDNVSESQMISVKNICYGHTQFEENIMQKVEKKWILGQTKTRKAIRQLV